MLLPSITSGMRYGWSNSIFPFPTSNLSFSLPDSTSIPTSLRRFLSRKNLSDSGAWLRRCSRCAASSARADRDHSLSGRLAGSVRSLSYRTGYFLSEPESAQLVHDEARPTQQALTYAGQRQAAPAYRLKQNEIEQVVWGDRGHRRAPFQAVLLVVVAIYSLVAVDQKLVAAERLEHERAHGKVAQGSPAIREADEAELALSPYHQLVVLFVKEHVAHSSIQLIAHPNRLSRFGVQGDEPALFYRREEAEPPHQGVVALDSTDDQAVALVKLSEGGEGVAFPELAAGAALQGRHLSACQIDFILGYQIGPRIWLDSRDAYSRWRLNNAAASPAGCTSRRIEPGEDGQAHLERRNTIKTFLCILVNSNTTGKEELGVGSQ